MSAWTTNVVHSFEREYPSSAFGLFTFPVKHKWMETADPRLIARSVEAFQRQLGDRRNS